MNIIITIVLFTALIWTINTIDLFTASVIGRQVKDSNYKLWALGSATLWCVWYYLTLIK